MEFGKLDNKNDLITQLKEVREENKRLQKRCNEYQFLIEDVKQGIWHWDVVKDVYSISPNSKEFYSHSFDADEFSIETWKKMIHPEDVDKALDILNYALENKEENYENVYRLRKKNGSYRWFLSKGKAIKNNEVGIVSITGSHTDITEKIDLESQLYNLAYYDSLTKLSNREKIMKDFNELLKNPSANHKKEIAFFFIDIDNFGYINDTLGQDEGNNILKKFAECLRERYCDELIARVSSDEFVVIYPYKDNIREAETEAKKLIQDIKLKQFIEYKDIKISFSIGISIYIKHGREFNDLLKNADIALRCAKKNGKDRFEIYRENMELEVYNYVDLVNQIRVGIEKEEFKMYYQPIVDTKTGVLQGLEALIRWDHTHKGFISPDIFIPSAEETDIMIHLEKWIIEEVFKQMEIWVRKKDMPLFVSVNLSSKGLIESNLVEFLNDMLEKYKISTEKIEFEVTETSMLRNIDNSIDVLNKLVERGFNISLDDFGTGYSSLNYLKNLPISKVKLDKSFIDLIEDNKKDQYLVKTIIDLSHGFGLRTIAEGIEDIEQINLLKQMGCDYLQGYYYGRPMSVVDIEKWIRENYI